MVWNKNRLMGEYSERERLRRMARRIEKAHEEDNKQCTFIQNATHTFNTNQLEATRWIECVRFKNMNKDCINNRQTAIFRLLLCFQTSNGKATYEWIMATISNATVFTAASMAICIHLFSPFHQTYHWKATNIRWQ